MASPIILLPLLLLLALAMVWRAHGLLPTLLLDKASALSDISAERILQEVNTGATISKQLCKEAGFLCGTIGSISKEGSGNIHPQAESVDENIFVYANEKSPSDESNIFVYPKVKSASSSSGESDENIFVYAKEESSSTATNKADENNILAHPKGKSASDSRVTATHHMHRHENEDKAAVLFFRMATASKGHKMVLPPLGDSSRLQASKFLHPSLEKVLGDMSVPRLLRAMGIPSRSGLAHMTMEKERLCTAEGPPAGEVKKCVASANAMLEFVASVLKASQHELKYMMNTRTQAASEVLEVADSIRVESQSFVTCHTMLFPYAVYMCHNVPETVGLKVTLRDSKGDKVTVPAICHMDTSHFEPSHIGFQVLHTRPGVGEMCHWMPNSHIIWYTEAAA